MDIKKYLKDPCNSLSMPYWKHKKTSTRSDIMIVHDNKFDPVLYRDWHDTVQFRLKHDLQGLTSTKINDGFFYKTVDDTCLTDVLSVINQTEKEIEITKNDLNHWKSEDSYCKELWILVYNKKIYHRNKDKTVIYGRRSRENRDARRRSRERGRRRRTRLGRLRGRVEVHFSRRARRNRPDEG